MRKNQAKQLEQQLWNIVTRLKGKMNINDLRNNLLGLIFYKYLSEKVRIYANSILESNGIKYKAIKENTEQGKKSIAGIRKKSLGKLGYFLKPSELFSELAIKRNRKNDVEGNFIIENLQEILKNIRFSTVGRKSEKNFENFFDNMDLDTTTTARNKQILKIFSYLNKVDFKLENTKFNILGDTYEYLIGKFVSLSEKKTEKFYTPQEVSTILARLVTTGKIKLKSVYDPSFGSGSLLLRVVKEIGEVSNFYGQELNRKTYNLARMNMIMHDLHCRKFDIKQEDTLEHPQHINQKFEAIVANPPLSVKWSANPSFVSDVRFSQYGKLAPKSKANYAFVQHMIHHLAENGTMAVVFPHDALSIGGIGQHIRRYLIEDRNYLDAVIALPRNIFYGTNISTSIMVFKKCRENPNDVLFIDARKGFKKAKQNILRPTDIKKIIDIYSERRELEKYSYLALLSEISETAFNLDVSKYVNTFEDEECADMSEASANEIVQEKSYAFAVQILKIYEYLCTEKEEFVLSKQLLRSGTSIGAKIIEATGGQSKQDIFEKFTISCKEARETHYWIRLLKYTESIDKEQSESLLKDIDELLKIIKSIQRKLCN